MICTMNWSSGSILVLATLVSLWALATAADCPTPPRLKNGRIRARGRGKIIRYSCYADFELVGNKYSTCIRGSWDTPTPVCVSTRCPSVPVPEHAVVGEKYRGAILMYFCEPDYTLVGNSEIYCDGRQWNATTPYCRNLNASAPTSCDFEKDGLCWWEQDPKHDFDWTRHRFDTPSSHIGTGPTHDHSLGPGYDGYYLYIEASGRLTNDAARIVSPLYPANYTESGCFCFWYHMYGATIGALNVYFKAETDRDARLAWSKSGNQGNQWLQALFQLPPVNASFQIIVEGVRGSSYVSDIAIDDLAILQGDQCVMRNASTPAPPSDGDEVEIFNANQSCKDRCVGETTPTSELYSSPDSCQCTIDCAEAHSCCPDFAEYCVYEMTDPPPETTLLLAPTNSSSSFADSTLSTATEISTTGGASETSERAVESTTTGGVKAIDVTLETPFVAVTERATRSPLAIATSSTTGLCTNPADGQESRQTPSTKLSLPGTIGIVVGALTGVTITMALLVVLRRRKSYKRGSNGQSAFSEDSDVRFLTSDEVLDFNLAKPAGDYEEM